MPSLCPHTVLPVGDRRSLTVLDYVAGGGQGEIYRVRLDPGGHIMALKWYHRGAPLFDGAFRRNIARNIGVGRPSPAFLWPEIMVESPIGKPFGYLMAFKPQGCIDFGKFFCTDRHPEAYLHSFMARVTASLTIADAIARLHARGCTFCDLNDGCFLIDPHTGHVAICDNDNVVPQADSRVIFGKPRYMAPEVAGGFVPTMASDLFSLAVILYRVMAVDHPFEGVKTMSPRYACLTPADEAAIFGPYAVFCHDTLDRSNAPDPVVNGNSVRFWSVLPPTLRRMFCTALSVKAIRTPSARVAADVWKRHMVEQRARLVTCTAVPNEPHDFLCDEAAPAACPICGGRPGREVWLRFADGLRYRLTPGKHLYIADGLDPVGLCCAMPQLGGTPGLQNLTPGTWMLIGRDNRSIPVTPGMRFQLMGGCRISFGYTNAVIL